ncbi:MAG: hypothetical protein IJG84_11305 [Kiritimatiellae bacterium]|nr:hypothetical protein [Kiritimatiellia bacterium]
MPTSSNDITADDILSLLAEKYSDAQRYICAAEVSPRTGAWERRIDLMVMNCFHSEEYKIQGFEIKISKEDLKRELMDPDKHAVFFKEIDYYWIVAPDTVLDKLDIIPPKWGVMKVTRTEDGFKLVTARKPIALHDEVISDRVISRPFAASILRSFINHSLGGKARAQEREELRKSIRAEVEQQLAKGAHVVPDWEYDSLVRAKRMCEALGLSVWYSGCHEYDIKVFREAKAVVENLSYLDRYLNDSASSIRRIRGVIKSIKDGSASAAAALQASADALEKTRKDKAEDGKVQGDDQR